MPERKIWELGYIVSRIIGLIFDEKELTRIFKKLELNNDCRSLSAARKHGLLVHLCSTENKASRHMDRILKKRFEPFRSRLKGIDQKEICRLIESGERLDGVPLSVLIWFAVREDNEEIEDIDIDMPSRGQYIPPGKHDISPEKHLGEFVGPHRRRVEQVPSDHFRNQQSKDNEYKGR